MALSRHARRSHLSEAYESTAQSFTIVTRPSEYKAGVDGRDLTRATPAATPTYPWLSLGNPPGKSQEEFAACKSDEEDLREACAGRLPKTPSLEAQLTDLMDAVSYGMHDLDDFSRARLIPPQTIAAELSREMDRLRMREK